MSTIRLPPYEVIPRTAPAGCSATSPMMHASSPPGVRSQRIESGVGGFGRDDREELAFVGDVQRIESQQLAGAAHGIAHRNLLFEKHDAQAAIASQFVQRGGDTAARGIAHPANAGPSGDGQRLHQRQNGTRVGAEIGFEIEFSARQQDGDAVIADRSGEQNLVAGADGLGIDPHPGIGLPMPVVVMYM